MVLLYLWACWISQIPALVWLRKVMNKSIALMLYLDSYSIMFCKNLYLAAILQCKLVEIVSICHLPLQQLDAPQPILLLLWVNPRPHLHKSELLIIWGCSELIWPPPEHVNLTICTGMDVYRSLESPWIVLPPPHNYTPACEEFTTFKKM